MILKEQTIAFDNQTWNRRYRGFMDKIKTGSVQRCAAFPSEDLGVDDERLYFEVSPVALEFFHTGGVGCYGGADVVVGALLQPWSYLA